jgi:hypothetical protein
MSKDLLEYVFSKDQNVMDLPVETIMQPTYFVPETMTIWTCFQEMRQRRVHMAIVVDEYGGTAGVITLEVCTHTHTRTDTHLGITQAACCRPSVFLLILFSHPSIHSHIHTHTHTHTHTGHPRRSVWGDLRRGGH